MRKLSYGWTQWVHITIDKRHMHISPCRSVLGQRRASVITMRHWVKLLLEWSWNSQAWTLNTRVSALESCRIRVVRIGLRCHLFYLGFSSECAEDSLLWGDHDWRPPEGIHLCSQESLLVSDVHWWPSHLGWVSHGNPTYLQKDDCSFLLDDGTGTFLF